MPFFTPGTANAPTLFYTLHGSASNPTILLLHGWTCDSHDFNFQIPFLCSTYHIIALDLRGHGRSSAPELETASVSTSGIATIAINNYTPQVHAADAVAVLTHLGHDQGVVVLGHSFGGAVASVLAITYPAFATALILLRSVELGSAARRRFARSGRAWGSGSARMGGGCIASSPAIIPSDYPAWLRTWYLRRALGTPAHVILGMIVGVFGDGGVGRREVWEEYAKERRVRRLAIYATEEGAELERGLGVSDEDGDEVVFMGGLGHWMHHVKVEEVNEIIGRWLRKVYAEEKERSR